MEPSDTAPEDGRVLIVDDDEGICDILARLVQIEGYEPLIARDGYHAVDLIRSEHPDVLLLDVKMPGLSGLEVMRHARKLDRDLPIVLITSHGLVKDAVSALRAGAHDYIVKPFEHTDVIRSLRSAMEDRGLRRTIRRLSDHTAEAARLRDLLGTSAAMARVSADAARVASSDFSVLITGEPGTGKEIVARAIHEASRRNGAPFVTIECGVLHDTLFESELFGHEKGAFSGATRTKPGKYDIARHGTLFIDDIARMPLGVQAKLLRVLHERSMTPMGGTLPVAVDVRLIAASSADLESAIDAGSFRRDLYFRLSEFVIDIPPLRQRTEDIMYLAQRFLLHTNTELHKSVAGFSAAATQRLLEHHWAGNVRELRSTIRRAVVLADDIIEQEHLGLRRPTAATAGSTSSAPVK